MFFKRAILISSLFAHTILADPTYFKVDTNTMALWRFDEGIGDTAFDASGNGNHAKLNNISWTNGLYNTAIELNGTNADAIIKRSATLISFKKSITLEAIIYPYSNTALWAHIVSSHNSYALSLHNGFPAVWIGSANGWWIPDTFLIQPFQWVRIAAQYTNDKEQLYINDCLLMDRAAPVTVPTPDSNDIRIGGDINNSIEDFLFHGKLDEIRISNAARYYYMAPLFLSQPDSIAYEGYQFTYIIKATNPDSAAITFTLQTPMPNLTLSHDTLIFRPDIGQIGSQTIRIKAVDVHNDSSVQSFNLNVKKRSSVITFLSLHPTKDTTITETDTLILRALAQSTSGTATLAYHWTINGTFKGNTPQCTLLTDYRSAGICTVKVASFDGAEFRDTTWHITINNKPAAPQMLYPEDGAMVRGDSIFCWNLIDPDFDSARTLYRIQFFKGSRLDSVIKIIDSIKSSRVRLKDIVKKDDLLVQTIFNWKVMAYDSTGRTSPYSAIRSFYYLDYGDIQIEKHPGIVPNKYALYQNNPNPFNPSTRITFAIPGTSEASNQKTNISIYNIKGDLVRHFALGNTAPGTYSVQWDSKDMNSRNCPNGVYLYKIRSGTFTKTLRMMLIK